MASYEFFRHLPDGLSFDALTGISGVPVRSDTSREQHVGLSIASSGKENPTQKTTVQHGVFSDPFRPSEVKPLSDKKKEICTVLPFFGPGTLITTRNGEIPVERLSASDHVLTRDHGFQPILWVGQTDVPAKHFRDHPATCPVVLPAGIFGRDCPTRPLCISSSHRVLYRAPEAELAFLSAEVLVAASTWAHLVDAERLHPKEVLSVTHIVMATHQVIMAEGAWVESTMATPDLLSLPDTADLAHVAKALGTEIGTQQAARPCLTRKEAMMLLKKRDHQVAAFD